MKRNKKGEMPEITREAYKNIKRCDHQQFKKFCESLYTFGFEDGRESVPGLDAKKVYEIVASVKGIGPKRLDEIRTRIEAAFGGEKTE